MRYPWLFILPLVGLIVAIAIVIWRSRQDWHILKRTALIAHTAAIKKLPEYRSVKKRYYVLVLMMSLAFVFCFICACVVMGRPVTPTVIGSDANTRDIMFCVDTSALDITMRAELNKQLSELEESYKGERVGVSLFDGEALLLAPFSKDYSGIKATMADYAERAATLNALLKNTGADGLSRVGDGVVACLNNFENLGGGGRVQALIIISDNLASSAQTASITQAIDYAQRYGVAVYGIDAGAQGGRTESETALQKNASAEFRQAVSAAGGSYYAIQEKQGGIEKILGQIEEQDRARVVDAAESEQRDAPQMFTATLVFGLIIFLVIIARLKL